MELGSAQHKKLLLKGIRKTALKTSLMGVGIGVLFIVPSLVLANTFSMGLAYAGSALILITLGYSVWLAVQKYQRIIKPFNETYRK